MSNLSQSAKAAQQLTFDTSTGTGSYLPFSGALAQNPSVIIFDNQSNVSVTISDDGTTDFKTFAGGQALVVDLRTNKTRSAEDFVWPIGTQFFANCASGTGLFYISYIYSK